VRKAKFDKALAEAAASGQIPQRTLPPQPSAPKVMTLGTQGMPVLQMPVIVKPEVGGSVEQRKLAMLDRVRAREAVRQSSEVKQSEDLRNRIRICDNAVTAHKILQSLFARGAGSNSRASEAEIMLALCSASFAVQSAQKLDKPIAQAAVGLLLEKGVDWFTVKPGESNPNAKYLRRLPKGNALKVLLAIKTERADLESQLRELCDRVKSQREQEQAAAQTAPEPRKELSLDAPSSKAEMQPRVELSLDEVPRKLRRLRKKTTGRVVL